MSKSLVAKEAILKLNPALNIEAHHVNIKELKISFFKQFSFIIMALDNIDARYFPSHSATMSTELESDSVSPSSMPALSPTREMSPPFSLNNHVAMPVNPRAATRRSILSAPSALVLKSLYIASCGPRCCLKWSSEAIQRTT